MSNRYLNAHPDDIERAVEGCLRDLKSVTIGWNELDGWFGELDLMILGEEDPLNEHTLEPAKYIDVLEHLGKRPPWDSVMLDGWLNNLRECLTLLYRKRREHELHPPVDKVEQLQVLFAELRQHEEWGGDVDDHGNLQPGVVDIDQLEKMVIGIFKE